MKQNPFKDRETLKLIKEALFNECSRLSNLSRVEKDEEERNSLIRTAYKCSSVWGEVDRLLRRTK